MLDVRRLHVLATVVETGSITAAASVLGYTPSAISQSVAALERESGTSLVEKAGRGIRPTKAGLLLAEHASTVMAALHDAEAALASFAAGESGRLQVAAFATAGANLVPRALARFQLMHRSVELDLVVADTEEAIAALRAGHTDVAVVALDDAIEGSGADDLQYVHLLDDPYRVVLPGEHRLANRRVISLRDLSDDAWVGTASTRCNSRGLITAACATEGFEPRFTMEADEFATALGFVGAGLGVALLPVLALGSLPDSVRVRRMRGAAPVRHVYAVTRPSIAGDAPVRAMIQALAESAVTYTAAA